jgi:hypothetical protein
MTKIYSDGELAAMTEFKVELHDDRYEVESIVRGGDFLYDPQVFWDWNGYGADHAWSGPAGSILISDIGGQPQREVDWNRGHGGIFRLNADNSWETIIAHGHGHQAGVFRPLIAPEGWGDFGGHIFFGSQVIPHRRGAVHEHMIYRVAPGDDTPSGFCVVPRAGKLGNGISGAFLTAVFGRKGTAEEGLFLVFCMHNNTIYAVRPDASIEPYIIMDGEDGNPGPVMPYRIYYADPQIVGEENMLVIEGKWNSNFGGEATHDFEPRHYRIEGRTVNPQVIESLAGGFGLRAPAAFGPFGGDSFRPENHGFISSVHWTEGDSAKALPYSAEIVRRDADGKEYVFASNVQAGQNLIGFAGDRMIVTNMHHSYSSGNFKNPDGIVFAIRYKGA